MCIAAIIKGFQCINSHSNDTHIYINLYQMQLNIRRSEDPPPPSRSSFFMKMPMCSVLICVYIYIFCPHFPGYIGKRARNGAVG
jgi:hypothetical protein